MADFSKSSYFSSILCFFKQFFAQKNSIGLVEWFFASFWHFQLLTQTDHFAKAIAYARARAFKMADFQNSVISRILCGCFFERFFAHNKSNVLVEWFSHLLGILNL